MTSGQAWEGFCAGGQDKAMVPLGRDLVVCTSLSGVQDADTGVQRWHHGR